MTRSIWVWLRILGGAGILGFLLWRLGTGAFLDGLRVIDGPLLALAFGIGVVTTVFSAWRWCLVARGLGLRLSLGGAIADYYKALFLNAALPGGVLGDVDRAVTHGRDEGDVAKSVRAVVLERTAGQLVLIGVGVTVLLTVPSPVLTALSRHGATVAVVVAALAAAAVILLLAVRKLRQGGSRVASAVRTGAAEIRTGLLARRNWPGVTLASTIVLVGHLATFVVAARAAGSTASLMRLAPLMLLALLAMSLPLNVGGWGPREAVTAWAFGAAGLSATQGLTTAVVYGVFAFVAALPGAAVLLVRATAGLRSSLALRRAVPVSPALALPVPVSPAPRPVPVSSAPALPVPPAALAPEMVLGRELARTGV
ncbi:lysylphosphatidylglycerol synthase transmembrane domain-containing protein [Actinoplanes sp. NPDC049596]|uniref:lysylphosphatidylglycerol synthase transmembrane domain-containing protein n=1 Tax=unclassified Actinoplanes TaxID=2626549 RepID=UPI00342CE520